MAHIKRIDLTRDVEAHADAYREAIEKVCRETAFSGGKYADTFDKEFAAYVGSRYASGVNNGTSALHLAMLALGVGPGDEVIVPANTYIATAWGVSYTGATPVFADCTAGYLGDRSFRAGGEDHGEDEGDHRCPSLRSAFRLCRRARDRRPSRSVRGGGLRTGPWGTV